MPTIPTLNSDQIFSAIRQLLTVVSVLVVSHGIAGQDFMDMATGILGIATSVGLSMWANADNWKDQVFSGVRQALLAVGTYSVSRGWITSDQIQQYSGGAFAVISSVLSLWFYREAPGPNLPGTTVVAPVVAPIVGREPSHQA